VDTETSLLVAGIGSGWLIVGYGVRMIFRGDLVTRREHEEAIANLREQASDVRETKKHLLEQNSLLLNSALPTVNAVLTALRQAAGDST
jgi:hypothetical protein